MEETACCTPNNECAEIPMVESECAVSKAIETLDSVVGSLVGPDGRCASAECTLARRDCESAIFRLTQHLENLKTEPC